MCPVFFPGQPERMYFSFIFKKETGAVLIKSLEEERQIWHGCSHMTVQNLDFMVLCMDVDSSRWRCAEGNASVLSSSGVALKMDRCHQSDFTINIWLYKSTHWAGVSYLVISSGFCLEVSHVASSMVRYTILIYKQCNQCKFKRQLVTSYK